MYKPVRLDARDRAVWLGAQGKAEQQLGGVERLGRAEQRLGGLERRLGGLERRLGGVGEVAELCGAAELLGVPLTVANNAQLQVCGGSHTIRSCSVLFFAPEFNNTL